MVFCCGDLRERDHLEGMGDRGRVYGVLVGRPQGEETTWKVWETGDVYMVFWWGDLRERDHLEDLDVDRRIILKCIFKK
jgi:hypothetical protein